jgi:regulator of microtubule dynamics protein 3
MKTCYWLLICSAIGAATPQSVSVSTSLAEASMLRQRLDEAGALSKYRQALAEDSSNLDALWNASYLATTLGARDSMHHSPLLDLGRHLAETALKDWPDHPESHFALAVNIAMDLRHLRIKEKVAASKVLRTEIRRTLELDPLHAGAWFLLGRWQYAYATLGPIDRMGAKLFLGGIPAEATVENAEKSFRMALQQRPEEPLFHLDLARTLVAQGRKEEARAVLSAGLRLAPRSGDDPGNLSKMRDLLKRIQG